MTVPCHTVGTADMLMKISYRTGDCYSNAGPVSGPALFTGRFSVLEEHWQTTVDALILGLYERREALVFWVDPSRASPLLISVIHPSLRSRATCAEKT